MSYKNGHIRYEQWFLPQKNFALYSATAKYEERLYAVIFPWWDPSGDFQYYRSVYVSSSDKTHLVTGEISEAAFQNYLNYEDGLGKHCGLLISNMATGVIGVDTENYPDYPTGENYQAYAFFDYITNETIIVWGGKYNLTFNIPIFDMTKHDSWTALNNYIATGDDSGADNYDDLHPMQYNTTVWMDGKYPNLYWKTEVGEEDTPDTIDLICDIYARPLIEYDKTFTNQYSLNDVQYVQYSEYANPSKVPSIGGGTIPTRYMLHVYPKDNLDKDYAARIVFDIHDDGTISDVTLQSSKHHTIIISDSPIPSDSDYPDEQTNFNHDMTTSFQDGTSINTLTTTYRISPSQLRVLGNFLWSNTFKDGILGLVNYPLENIVSLKCMPVKLGGTDTTIKIGNVDTGIHGDKCDYRVSGYSAYVGSCTIKRPFNNFMDYTEVELSIYLPFIGYKPLDAVMVMGRKIELTYIYDCVLGNCMAVLYVYDDNGNKIMFDCHQGTCGIDIAITSTNRADIENGMINSVLSGIGHLASAYAGNIGGVLGVASDVFNGTTQGFHTQSTGVGNPSLMTKMDTTAFVILKRPQIMDVDKQHYGHHYGYPCNLYKKLKNLSGFTQTKNFVCSLINNATDEEKAEIESLLNSGIYIM